MLIPICNSFGRDSCKNRLDYYVEREFTDKRVVIEKCPCVFYNKGKCGIDNGLIGHYIRGYPYELPIFEKKDGRLVEISKLSETILSVGDRNKE